MNVITYSAFKNELEKIAYHSLVDIAGLGVLAAPTIQKVRGKEMSDKGTHAAELGGLGMLAGTSAHKIYSAAKKGGLAAIKHASVAPSLTDAASLRKQAGIFGGGSGMRAAMTDAAHMAQKGLQSGGAKRLGVAGASAVKAPARLATQVPRAIPTAAQVGGHAFKPDPSRAISIPGLT
jgi:hypothetical protein